MGRDDAGAGGPAGARTTKSLRERGGKAAGSEPAKKNLLEPKRVATNAALALVVVIALLLILRDGGAAQAGAATNVSAVAEWALYATAPDGTERLLCDHSGARPDEEPPADAKVCTEGELQAAEEAGQECRVEARVHLASKGNPMLLVGMRDIRVNMSAISIGESTSALPLNLSTFHGDWEEPWPGGWWLRAFPQRLSVSFPMPCNALTYSLNLELEGRTWTGADWSASQTANQVLYVPDPAAFARPDPGDGNQTRPTRAGL